MNTNWFPLPIFPEGSLASSVVTTVWVGVAVMCFMNLRFGWVLSGLVVPGYIVPLMIVKPAAAAVIVVEAFVTYWIVRSLAKLLPRFGLACSFFGRERFLMMLIVSSSVRVLFDAWLLPDLGDRLAASFGFDWDGHDDFHSFGLVVICLAANQLWKTGAVRGTAVFAFNLGMTFLVVRYGLMEFTNFSISNLGFLYEDIATSIHAAPKAYIVLLTTTILASRMTLLYGWDFNGLLIPALIALQWYEPLKVLTSFAEALATLGVAVLIMKLPCFRAFTMEGARKILLFFTISFLYKMAVAYGLLIGAPLVKVSDFYGAGYLLPTLMAIKMHQSHKVVHQLCITFYFSLFSIAVASAIGFALTWIPDWASPAYERAAVETNSGQHAEADWVSGVRKSFVEAHEAVIGTRRREPWPDEIFQFEKALETVPTALGELQVDGYRTDRFGERFLRLAPTDPGSGRPIVLFDIEASNDLMVQCPDALDEVGTFDAALALFRDQKARCLVIGGGGPRGFGEPRSWLSSIHDKLGKKGVIQVRHGGETNRLFVKRSLPETLNLSAMEGLFGASEVLWREPRWDNAIRDASEGGFCELLLGQPTRDTAEIVPLTEPIDSLIRRELGEFAPKASNLYTVPTPAELLHFDRQVLRPLFRAGPGDLEAVLATIAPAAHIHGYVLSAYRANERETFVLLREDRPERFWGSALIRVGGGSAFCFEIPSRIPNRSLLSFAATQFRRFQARALIVAGVNSLTNTDGTSDLTRPQNAGSLFNLTHQALLRESALSGPAVVQCRAFLPAPGEAFPEGGMIVSPYQEFRSFAETARRLAPLVTLWGSDGVDVSYVDEADETSPYAVGNVVQARYMDFSEDGVFAIAWLSPFLQQDHRFQDENRALLTKLRASGIPFRSTALRAYLGGQRWSPAETAPLKKRIHEFRQTGDVHALANLSREFPDFRFEAVLDSENRQLFLVCLNEAGTPCLVANIGRSGAGRMVSSDGDVETFVDSRAAWLEPTLSE